MMSAKGALVMVKHGTMMSAKGVPVRVNNGPMMSAKERLLW